MEGTQVLDINILIDVLCQGNDNIMALESLLYDHQPSSEACKLLTSKVQASLATAITITKLLEHWNLPPPPPPPPPLSVIDNRQSKSSDKAFTKQGQREICKKRKALPRWSTKVHARSGSAMEMSLGDGYSWRKYGQKDILGAKFPRCYYRCTLRHSHGCLATRQIQRSDDNSYIFDITYRGAHTCGNGIRKNSTEEQSIHQTETSPSFSFPSPSANSWKKPATKAISDDSKSENYNYTMSDCLDLDWEIADFLCASTSNTSSLMEDMNFGVEQFAFDSETSFDFC